MVNLHERKIRGDPPGPGTIQAGPRGGTYARAACGVLPFLLAAFLLCSCRRGLNAPSFVLKLTEAGRIASVTGPYREAREGRTLLIEEIPPFLELDPRSPWYFFSLALEAKDASLEDLPDRPFPRPEVRGGAVRIPRRMGVAFVVPVQGPADIHVACRGTFDPSSQCTAGLMQLQRLPELGPDTKPGTLRKYIWNKNPGSYNTVRLLPAKDGRSAEGVIHVDEKARAVLFTFIATGDRSADLEGVRCTELAPVNLFLYERRVRGFPHPALVPAPFVEATVRPSVLLFPGTTVTWKPLRIPEQGRLTGALCVEKGPASAPLRVTLSAVTEKGERVELFRARLDSEPSGWKPFRVDLGAWAGRALAFTTTCAYEGDAPAAKGAPSAALLGGLSLCGCAAEEKAPPPPFNLVLISLDTLRRDHLGCYGYTRPTSPRIDRFAKRCFLFERYYAQAPYTIPSHASLFTSLYPTVHGMHAAWNRFSPNLRLLAEVLSDHGMATASFNNGGYLSHEMGFFRGFDLYCEVDPIGDRYYEGHPPHNPHRLADGSCGSLPRAFDWIRERGKDERFFLFLHTFMIHEYMPPKAVAQRFNEGSKSLLRPDEKILYLIDQTYVKEHGISPEHLRFFENLYDAGILAADRMVGEVVDFLEQAGLMDETVVIITSDHGEEFMDHGGVKHCKSVYNELIRVPLLIYIPGMEGGQRIEARVGEVDVMPTVLDLFHLASPLPLQGRSLLPLMKGEERHDRFIYSETRMPKRYDQGCVVVDGWKYVRGNTDPALSFPAPAPEELFFQDTDPHERQNVLQDHPEVAARLRKIMARFRKELERLHAALGASHVDDRAISKSLREVLHQQGYF